MMFKKLSYTLLVFALIFTCLICRSQTLRVLSAKDGLPQSFIAGLIQDDSGFIWIGTRGGLARYNGINFKLFQHSIRDSSTIASNLIIGLKKGQDNTLWIEYESGAIDIFNPKTEKLKHFSINYIFGNTVAKFFRRAWTTDTDLTFWAIGETEELISVSRRKEVNRYRNLNYLHQTTTLLGLLADKSNNLWVLTSKGLSLLNRSSRRFSDYPTPVPQQFSNDFNSEVIGLHQRVNGELMWGDRKQLFFFNPLYNTYRTVKLPSISAEGVRYSCGGPDGSEYFELDGEIFRYNDQSGITPVLKTKEAWSSNIRSFLVDRSGLIWIGTNGGGIRLLDLTNPFFQSFSYKSDFFQDVVKQQLGLSVSEMFDWQIADGRHSSSGYLFRSSYDQQGRLWLMLKQTVGFYDKQLVSFVKLPLVSADNHSDATPTVLKALTIMPDGQPMVICNDGQILYYNPKKKKWLPVIEGNAVRKTFGLTVLPLDIFDDGNVVWISTENSGLIYLDLKTKRLHQLTYETKTGGLPTDQLLAIKPDPARPDYLWIGSYEGLIALNKRTLRCEVFTTESGLPDNTIYSIITDKMGYLWLSTNKGLCRFDPVTHQVKVFQTTYGLPGLEFNRFHQLNLPDGQFAFGGTEGWVMFNPLAVKDDDFNPDIAFTNLKVNNISVNNREAGNLYQGSLNAVSKLMLPYEQNTLTFEFAGLQFNQPGELSYRYQLIGYDKAWVLAGHTPLANYTKVPPGNYTFRMNASNTAGKWSNRTEKIIVVIASPWWRTWWAVLCYFALAGLLLWRYIRYSVRMQLLNHEVRLKENEAVQLKKLNEVKNQFFANITHEFRTPLTLILGPTEQLKEKYKSERPVYDLAETIENNAGHLLHLINQLMDLARLEANATGKDQLWGSPAMVTAKIVNSFANNAGRKGLLLRYNDSTDNLNCWFSPNMLERIVYNLLSNAMKFTGHGGTINVDLEQDQTCFKLRVSDSGIGIPAKELAYIFDRFYQSSNQYGATQHVNGYNGTGIGLTLVKELAEVQGGSVSVQSSTITPRGSTFTVILPYRKDNPGDTVTVQEEHANMLNGAQADEQAEILVIEDNAELASFMMASLAGVYKVAHAANGLKGAEVAFRDIPDLVISDVLMDEMNGFELCALLKQDVRTSHIPVILLTAVTEQEKKFEGLSLGADDYLTKPFYMSELLMRIKNQLYRQQKLREYVKRELGLPDPANDTVVSQPQHLFINQLYNIIELHLDDSLFGVDELINAVNMSRTSLHRKIKALSGMSTSELIRNYRLKRAAQFLQQGLSSADVAYKTGFGSPAYFSKCFREFYGLTPVEFSRKT